MFADAKLKSQTVYYSRDGEIFKGSFSGPSLGQHSHESLGSPDAFLCR